MSIVSENINGGVVKGEEMKKITIPKDIKMAFNPCPKIIYNLLKDRKRLEKAKKHFGNDK